MAVVVAMEEEAECGAPAVAAGCEVVVCTVEAWAVVVCVVAADAEEPQVVVITQPGNSFLRK